MSTILRDFLQRLDNDPGTWTTGEFDFLDLLSAVERWRRAQAYLNRAETELRETIACFEKRRAKRLQS